MLNTNSAGFLDGIIVLFPHDLGQWMTSAVGNVDLQQLAAFQCDILQFTHVDYGFGWKLTYELRMLLYKIRLFCINKVAYKYYIVTIVIFLYNLVILMLSMCSIL